MTLSISPISTLQHAYRAGRCSVADVLDHLLERADRTMARNVWITRLSRGELLGHAGCATAGLRICRCSGFRS
jgi:hypothetical protein